jgi:PAS domain S-box-containing protein
LPIAAAAGWLRINGVPIYGEDGHFSSYRGTARDITEQKQVEQRLRAAEERYRLLYNRTPTMLHAIDLHDRLLSVSDFWLDKMGYTREEVLGRRASDFMTSSSRDRMIQVELPKVVRDGTITNVGLEFVKSGGETFDVLLSAVRERDEKGNIARILAVVTDVSALHAATEDLNRKNLQLTNANQELERFTYIVSHDLRAPLRACSTVCQHLLEDADERLDDDQKKTLGLVRARLSHMHKMLGDLLEYNRLGRSTPTPERLNAAAVIDSAISLLEHPPGIDIVVQPDMPELQTHWGTLEHVFRNLIENAIVHHDKGRGRIEIGAEDQGDCVLFAVQDDGPGIPEQHQEAVFEPFRRLQSSGRGTGMGLALVKRAVDNVGGKIEVVSRDGERGTLWRVTWPKRLRAAA